MKIIDPSYSEVDFVPLWNPKEVEFALAYIESAGRTCYKSEDRINEDSALKFVAGMFKSGHMSVLEHSNIVIKTINNHRAPVELLDECNASSPGTFIDYTMHDGDVYASGNLRAWIEATHFDTDNDIRGIIDWILMEPLFNDGWKVVTDVADVPPLMHRFGCRIVHDRAFTHELVRHRVLSYSQESQRYCNYTKEKFGREITYIESKEIWDRDDAFLVATFESILEDAETAYFELIDQDVLPQVARGVLPNACKTEIFTSGPISGWYHLFHLRTAKGAHPDMRYMIPQIMEEVEVLKDTYIKNQ